MSRNDGILNYMNQTLGEGTHLSTQRGTQYSYMCPFCDDYKRRMFVNVDKHVYFCHHCEAKGSLVSFISDYAKINWHEALKVYRMYEGYSAILPESLESEIYSRLAQVKSIQQQKIVHPLPKEFIPITDAEGVYGRKAVKYLRSRGVSLSQAEKCSIGYCATGDYANRIIMPDFEDGRMVFWQARTWTKTPRDKKKFHRKVLNPSLTKEQIEDGVLAIDKSEVISNIDTILEQGMAVICEGKFDAYTLQDIGGCIHGKHMSDTQFMKLVMNKDKIDVIAIMLDEDAMANAISLADRLYRHFNTVLICRLPKGMDPNSLGRQGCLKALNEAIEYSPMFSVRARIKGWT